MMQNALGHIAVSSDMIDYVTDIVRRTRAHRSVMHGASPRGAIALVTAARARAALEGRDYMIPDDVKQLAPSVLRHRLILQPEAEFEGITADRVVEVILGEAQVPKSAA
jgi:MoxR-like ATPase